MDNLTRWKNDLSLSDFPDKDDNALIIDKIDSLAALERAVCEFEGCDLKNGAKNTVFADGNPKADLMIIGEAPGANEDEQGIPFCGLSGKLLDQMLGAIQLDRKSTYITNVVFWRPEGNRRPTDIEIATCMPFVKRHIALVKPKVLLLLGSTAVNALIDTDINITRLRGQVLEYKNELLDQPISTVVSYHPSYLLRRPLGKREAWHDFLRVQELLSIVRKRLNINLTS